MTYNEVRNIIKRWTGKEVGESQWCGIKSHKPEVWHRDVINGPERTIYIPTQYHTEWEQYRVETVREGSYLDPRKAIKDTSDE